MSGRKQNAQTLKNLPSGWPMMFAPVPEGRSSKVRCLLCGRMGYEGNPQTYVTFDGRTVKARPSPWQLSCIRGHDARCEVCRRPFVHGGALAAHQRCKLHHKCCRDHTTVPAWKNPFREVAA